ncbi:MAG: hypothetical protein R3237_01625 [Nitrosopumilaceae archaeon]|nr:hypothetical protein [Nitrosopumilaceae archaeon]
MKNWGKNLSYGLPEEFTQRLEKDLNSMTEGIPDIIDAHYEFLKNSWNYSNAYEFLIGLIVGNCQLSYIQAFYHQYEKMPNSKQLEKIHNIISRRKVQIEQGVSAFLEENNIS